MKIELKKEDMIQRKEEFAKGKIRQLHNVIQEAIEELIDWEDVTPKRTKAIEKEFAKEQIRQLQDVIQEAIEELMEWKDVLEDLSEDKRSKGKVLIIVIDK